MSDEVLAAIENCSDLRQLEMLYLPFKPKRRTKASIARERGLQPLADLLVLQEPLEVSRNATLDRFVNPALEIADRDAALQGALAIVAEQWSEDATLRSWMLDDAKASATGEEKRGRKI